jgi:hypothetical protein
VSVKGLQQIHRVRPEAARILLFLCAAHFIFWYGMHLIESDDSNSSTFAVTTARAYETWDSIDRAQPDRRADVNEQLAKIRGPVLLFVRYWPQHIFQDEWVYNEADVDRARVVWARDLGRDENEKLRLYYPGRTAWLLEPDARPPKLSPYQPEPSAAEQSATEPSTGMPGQPPKPKSTKKNDVSNWLEDVPRK